MPNIKFSTSELVQYLPVCKLSLKIRLGDNWSNPKKFYTYPHLLVKSRIVHKTREYKLKDKKSGTSETTEGRGDRAERKLLSAVKELKDLENCPHGYFISDTNLGDCHPDDELQLDAIFISPDSIVAFEVKDYHNVEEAVAKAMDQLDKRLKAIDQLVQKKIPVSGAIVLPFTDKYPKDGTTTKSGYLVRILFQQDLHCDIFSGYLKQWEGKSSAREEDKENALAKTLLFTFLSDCYPASEEEFIHLEAQKIFLRRNRNYKGSFIIPSFNSIELTEEQKKNAKDMSNMQSGIVVINGPYGSGKTFTVIKALQNRVKKLEPGVKLNILFLSAQMAFNGVKTLHYSPFLETVKGLIEEALSPYECIITGYNDELINHREEKPISIKLSLSTSRTSLESLTKHWENNDKDIIILDETNALTSDEMEEIIKHFEKKEEVKEVKKLYIKDNTVIWVTSNLDDSDFSQKYWILENYQFKSIRANANSIRNTSEIISFANQVETIIAPERFPSGEMLRSNTPEGIPISHCYEEKDSSRVKSLILTIEKWLEVPSFKLSQLLVVNAENDEHLLSEMKKAKLPFREYSKPVDGVSFLFLQEHSKDPIESIVAGGEWEVMIFYCSHQTITSNKATHLFNKRILSRVTTKLYLFSNYPVEQSSLEKGAQQPSREDEQESSVNKNDEQTQLPSRQDKQESSASKINEQAQLHSIEDEQESSVNKNDKQHIKVEKEQDKEFMQNIEQQEVFNALKKIIGTIPKTYRDLLIKDGYKMLNFEVFDSKKRNDVWLTQELGTSHNICLFTLNECLDTLQDARDYFDQTYSVRLPLIHNSCWLSNKDSEQSLETCKEKVVRLSLLLDRHARRQTRQQDAKGPRWVEFSSAEYSEEFLKSFNKTGK